MMEFQAKNIQSILGINKSRYGYILMKIGVDPDIEKVYGTGRTNLFSFARLLEFGIASTGIDIGMSTDILKFSIRTIRQHDDEENWDFFQPGDNRRNLSFHVGVSCGALFYCFSGDVRPLLSRQWIFQLPDGMSASRAINSMSLPDIDRTFNTTKSVNRGGLEKSLGYSTINLSEIKGYISGKIG